LGELLRELERAGVEPTAANAPRVEETTPRTVGRSLRTRLRRLPPSCRSLARAVAVLGDGASLATAAALARLEQADAGAAADTLAGAGLLEDERPLAFVHPLVRSSVYAELSAGERAAWHARAAALLAAEEAPSERVALHLLACEPRGDAEAVERLRSAAREAR